MVAGCVIALLMAASLAAADDREWVVQAGAAVCGADDFVLVGGRSIALGVATPVEPWLLVGAEGAWQEFRPGIGTTESNGVFNYDRSTVISGTLNARFQVPVHSGPSAYSLLEAGIGHASLSELRWVFETTGISPSRTGAFWITGAGLGLRFVLPRDWPELDASIRGGYWTSPSFEFQSGHRASYGQLRLACAF